MNGARFRKAANTLKKLEFKTSYIQNVLTQNYVFQNINSLLQKAKGIGEKYLIWINGSVESSIVLRTDLKSKNWYRTT